MKKLVFPLLLLFLCSFSVSSEGLTDEERARAVTELQNSRDSVLNTLEGMTDEQLHFKPDEDSWSLAEITEHLAIVEGAVNELIEQTLNSPADAEKKSDHSDDEILGMIRDRSQKVKTQPSMEPTEKFGGFGESLKTFKSRRNESISYVKTTDDDLREHFTQMPFGTVDAYQLILFMSGHTDRHVQQMHEVISDDNFPSE